MKEQTNTPAVKSTITPQQGDVGSAVIERKRKIVFTNGDHLNLRNITRINHMGT